MPRPQQHHFNWTVAASVFGLVLAAGAGFVAYGEIKERVERVVEDVDQDRENIEEIKDRITDIRIEQAREKERSKRIEDTVQEIKRLLERPPVGGRR